MAATFFKNAPIIFGATKMEHARKGRAFGLPPRKGSANQVARIRMADRLIYVLHNGKQHGPFGEQAVQQSVATGETSMEDLAWCSGAPAWVPLSTLLAGSPPPSPPHLQPPADVSVANVPDATGGQDSVDGLWRDADTLYRKLHGLMQKGDLSYMVRGHMKELEELEARLSRTSTLATLSTRRSEIRQNLDGCRKMLVTGEKLRWLVTILALPVIAIIIVIFAKLHLAPVVAGLLIFSILGVLGHLWGILKHVEIRCENCGAPPPPVLSAHQTIPQALRGGWTCPNCRKPLNRKGAVVT